MPTSRAMVSAVVWLSPVIMNTRMPAARHCSMLARTSGRAGSLMPQMPNSVSPCSIVSKLLISTSCLSLSHLPFCYLCAGCFGPS